MMVGIAVLAGFALFVLGGFAWFAWTGRIAFSRTVLLDRHKDPLGFWIVWTLGLGLSAFCLIRFYQMTRGTPVPVGF
jgi:hypothetical protein